MEGKKILNSLRNFTSSLFVKKVSVPKQKDISREFYDQERVIPKDYFKEFDCLGDDGNKSK